MNTANITSKIKYLLKKRKITIKSVAEQIGLSREVLTNMLNNKTSLRVDVLLQIGKVLEVRPDWFYQPDMVSEIEYLQARFELLAKEYRRLVEEKHTSKMLDVKRTQQLLDSLYSENTSEENALEKFFLYFLRHNTYFLKKVTSREYVNFIDKYPKLMQAGQEYSFETSDTVIQQFFYLNSYSLKEDIESRMQEERRSMVELKSRYDAFIDKFLDPNNLNSPFISTLKKMKSLDLEDFDEALREELLSQNS